jgi:glycosyltransferase involved in cell wall biosynthesis
MERVKIVPPAVDSRRFRPVDDVEGLRSRLNIGPDDKTVLFVSDLSYRDRRRHGDYLIDATALLVRHIPGIHLAIVGEGDLLPSLRERARGLGLASKVSFAGRVTGDDLAQYYAACDVFAFPSTYESFGYVVLEAMASGKPCVVCDIPGVRDLVEPGVTGLRVPPDDVPALAEALGMLLENNRMRMSMGREARGRAASRTWEQVAEDMVGVYRETLRGRPGVQPSGRTRPA